MSQHLRRIGGSRRLRSADPADDAQRHGRVTLPGGALAYTTAGAGDPVLLIHGLGGTRHTWRWVIDSLATTHTVIAPDLPGHGESDPPAGDYSLGAHAAALRDLLVALGHPRATVVGHSLGGGIGLQFAYQFPERTQRLLLISSGGLGTELTPMLRAATLPGARAVIAGLSRLPEALTRLLLRTLTVFPGVIARQDIPPLAEGIQGLAGAQRRSAFVRTAHAVIDWKGQTVSASRQLRLLADLPVLVAWGTDDRTIPPHHHQTIIRQLPDSCALEISGAGHYPHETAPERLLPAVHAFLASTAPFRYDETRWRRLLTGTSAGLEPVPE
jgi:pimeloyl-ACP methyl ester carboxylesterase